MAVTSIWAIDCRMDKVIEYVENPEKTIERPEQSTEALAARAKVGDVIDYAENGDKTEQMMFVTGINCSPETAADDFMRTKLLWGKTGGRLAYHGYQSFKEGDGAITAQKAHEIGVKLAEELWGDRYEVVVATHLNTGHYHNHYVVNSVSLKDGIKYHRTMADYRQMQLVSDRLCREAGLHVVEQHSVARGKNYSEWSAEKEGRPTVRGRIRENIDYAIRMSRTEKEFIDTMKVLGYEFKFYKPDGTEYVHPGIKPPGAKSFFRFDGLGPNYDLASIKRRIIENTLTPGTPLLIEKRPYRKWEPPEEKLTFGLPHFYRRYCLRLYSYVSRPAKKEYIPMALREDIVKLDHYIDQMDFLYGNKIEDQEELKNKRLQLQKQLNDLYAERRQLYTYRKAASRSKNGGLLSKIRIDIKEKSRQIREVKKQIDLCDEVFISTDRVLKGLEMPEEVPVIDPINKRKVR